MQKDQNRQADAEIEITPEMIETGARVLRLSCDDYFPVTSQAPEILAAQVLRAMLHRRRKDQ